MQLRLMNASEIPDDELKNRVKRITRAHIGQVAVANDTKQHLACRRAPVLCHCEHSSGSCGVCQEEVTRRYQSGTIEDKELRDSCEKRITTIVRELRKAIQKTTSTY
jgi:hypothetical protein